ncbi:MAG: FG-GAP-like repeat-containing protein, partial [Saprospiraceae bacterium]|nr:FG-GAP-like repeat-containing protein [Saprospiraceae bacterium]
MEAKNGMRYEYGKTTGTVCMTEDGSTTIAWYLNKAYDQYGNYMEYAYEKIGREMRISEIRYTGNTAASILPYNKIKFNYLERADKKNLYTAGSMLALNSLLTEIVVTTEGGTLVRKYKFNYAKDELNHSFLQEVVEFGSNATQLSLNSTIFKYKKPDLTMNKTAALTLPAGYEMVGTGDYNGDGLSDIVAVTYTYHTTTPREITTIATFLKNSAVNDNGYTQVSVDYIAPNNIEWAYDFYSSTPTLPQAQDFDGDGKDDILIYFVNRYDGQATAYYNIYSLDNDGLYRKWTNNTFGTHTGKLHHDNQAGIPGLYSVINAQNQFATTGDFDGDGKTDILALVRQAEGAITKLVFIKPNRTTPAKSFLIDDSYFWSDQQNNLFSASNIDADGKSELILRYKHPNVYDARQVVAIKPSATSTPAAPKYTFDNLSNFEKIYVPSLGNFKLGDFNGDGNTDIVYKNTNNSVYYEFSTGKKYVAGATIVFAPTTSNIQDWNVGDFNGDGLTDIVCSYKVCTYYYPYPQCITRPEGCGGGTNCVLYFDVYYSTGSSFVKKTYSNSYYNSSLDNNTSGNLTIADFNGDGKSDIMTNQANTHNVYSFNPSGNDFLLEKVQNGFMQTSQVTYKSIAESGSPYVRNEPSSYPLNVTKAPIKVVTALTTPNGIGGTTTSTYKYENARLHRSGFGFLGFGKFQVDNPVQYAQVITETEVLTPYQSPVTYYFPVVKTVTSSQVLGNVTLPVSKTTNTSSPTFNGTRYWMKVDATTSTNNPGRAQHK